VEPRHDPVAGATTADPAIAPPADAPDDTPPPGTPRDDAAGNGVPVGRSEVTAEGATAEVPRDAVAHRVTLVPPSGATTGESVVAPATAVADDTATAAGQPPAAPQPSRTGAHRGILSDDTVAAEVADQLGAVVGHDVEADPAEFAAAAVLDVLRASGWADAGEANELRAEANRLRELLAEVIRDHRARVASMAGVENQQLHWLVPLLRAAHGVAFGSLGAKVALRTAVQEVPPEVLASAGLRIDYGVEPDYGAEPGNEDTP
jgi:hypothetical protein